jgi:hypothetical protein
MYADAVDGISSFSPIAISAALRRAMSRQRLPSDGQRAFTHWPDPAVLPLALRFAERYI